MYEEEHAYEAHDSSETADDDREHLLRAMGNTERVEHPNRRQETDEMSEENNEDADMEEDAAHDQLPATQELA
jgi:hypothetical protein